MQYENPATSSVPQPSKLEILTAAAEVCLSEGYAILPGHPDGKTPYACSINEQGHPLKFYNGVHSVYSPSFGPRREYGDPKTGRKRLTTPALETWKDGIACNVLIALELSDLTALDIDEGIDSETELKEFLAAFSIPSTRCIRSGRIHFDRGR